MSGLAHMFKVRLANFKATGINARGDPPFCIRGNFDGKAFHTEYFHGHSMSPMWALDARFDYHTPTVDVLGNKFLLLECYGNDVFLGMCRVDLHSLCTGPTAVELSMKEGERVTGTLSFDVYMEHVTNTTIQLTRVALGHVAARGVEQSPSPFLSYGFVETGNTLESLVAPNATSPEWDRLPPLHKRCSYAELCDSAVRFEVKHARNGFSPGVCDPVMATFDINLATLLIEVGRDSTIVLREMVHSLPGYPHPFSTQLSGVLEIRNAPKLVQLRGGLLTDTGIIGGVSAVPSGSPHRRGGSPARFPSPVHVPSPVRAAPVHVSPTHRHNSSYVQPAHHHAPAPAAGAGPYGDVSRSHDVEVLEEVGDRQSSLLTRVHARLQDVSRRRADVTRQISTLKNREDELQEASRHRRGALEADLQTAQSERDRLEEQLRVLALRREEEARTTAHQAAEREKARLLLEDEQREVAQLQHRVAQLRDEMTRHLNEEEARYAGRVQEAEESRRRANQDAEDLALLEARLGEAETRAARRHSDDTSRHGRSPGRAARSPHRR
jgi:hypothetical protein